MTYFVHQTNVENGEFELIDGDFMVLYPNIRQEELIALSEAEYDEFCQKGNELTRLHEGKLVYQMREIDEQQEVVARKAELISRISTKADQLKSFVFAGYSTAEVESFYRQEKEALALKDDPNYPALMLTSIANSRGVPLEILAQKVLEKADLAAPIIGDILGKKQRFEGLIQAVENLDDLADLEKEIEQWQL